jgi:hypothetical protein
MLRPNYVYAPTLIAEEAPEALRREKLVEWSDEDRAKELVDLPRERLSSRATQSRHHVG